MDYEQKHAMTTQEDGSILCSCGALFTPDGATTTAEEWKDWVNKLATAPVKGIVEHYQYSTSPTFPNILWPDFEEFVDVNDIAPGQKYWARTVTYGPWEERTR